MRNVKKNVNEGLDIIQKRPRLDMSVSELDYFLKEFVKTANKDSIKDAIWDAVAEAYYMGLAVGMKNSK